MRMTKEQYQAERDQILLLSKNGASVDPVDSFAMLEKLQQKYIESLEEQNALLRKSADNYLKTSQDYPLYVASSRYGLGFYGMLVPDYSMINDLDSAIASDKSVNLVWFLDEYKCFPFALGSTHEEIIVKIKERTSKYFNEYGNWKIKLENEGEYFDYGDVFRMIFEWFEEARKHSSGTPWNVIDTKKREGHWLFDVLKKEIERIDRAFIFQQ